MCDWVKELKVAADWPSATRTIAKVTDSFSAGSTKLGYNRWALVRDEGGKQYWRLADRPTDSIDA